MNAIEVVEDYFKSQTFFFFDTITGF